MKGDFTRDTFDPSRHFLRVLMQQGRVQLDADWNEQTAILLHYLQSLAADLIGPHGGVGPDSFKIELINKDGSPLQAGQDLGDLKISPGRYYVQGRLCENAPLPNADGALQNVTYGGTAGNIGQPYYTPDMKALPDSHFLVYLDVWERHVCAAENADLLEPALGGPDTTTRSELIWQVKLIGTEQDPKSIKDDYKLFLGELGFGMTLLPGIGTGKLRAQAKVDETALDNPCILSPDALYRGAENQLYRVEIHTGGKQGDEKTAGAATFKWSRENGSVVFPIVSREAALFTLEHLGLDARLGLEPGDYVEILDDDSLSLPAPAPLLKVSLVDPTEMTVTLEAEPASTAGNDSSKHPFLRRWDQKSGNPSRGGLRLLKDGTALVVEANGAETNWLELEDGVQIQFQADGQYRSGDYWLIPARVATGNILWPPPGHQDAAWASGVAHYYAPLALVAKGATTADDCRRLFSPLAT